LQRDLAEERDAAALGQLAPAAAQEDLLVVPAARADVAAHVLDEAEHGHLDPLPHAERLLDVDDRDLLRRRHHDGARDGQQLRERELRVARAGRQVDDR
jgi:hypothetical protein